MFTAIFGKECLAVFKLRRTAPFGLSRPQLPWFQSWMPIISLLFLFSKVDTLKKRVKELFSSMLHIFWLIYVPATGSLPSVSFKHLFSCTQVHPFYRSSSSMCRKRNRQHLIKELPWSAQSHLLNLAGENHKTDSGWKEEKEGEITSFCLKYQNCIFVYSQKTRVVRDMHLVLPNYILIFLYFYNSPFLHMIFFFKTIFYFMLLLEIYCQLNYINISTF